MSSGGTICLAASTTCRSRVLPPTSCRTFGRWVLSRVPFPAAMITMANCIGHSPLNAYICVQYLRVKLKCFASLGPWQGYSQSVADRTAGTTIEHLQCRYWVIDVPGFLLHIHAYSFSRWYREAYR